MREIKNGGEELMQEKKQFTGIWNGQDCRKLTIVQKIKCGKNLITFTKLSQNVKNEEKQIFEEKQKKE